eukprot:8535956-Lingulodinium_polyedra.AAC.1
MQSMQCNQCNQRKQFKHVQVRTGSHRFARFLKRSHVIYMATRFTFPAPTGSVATRPDGFL